MVRENEKWKNVVKVVLILSIHEQIYFFVVTAINRASRGEITESSVGKALINKSFTGISVSMLLLHLHKMISRRCSHRTMSTF